jgi:hypothetical protein
MSRRKRTWFITYCCVEGLELVVSNLFNVWTYRSEFNLTLFHYFIIPSLSRKTLVMTLPAEILILNFPCLPTNDSIHFFSSVGRNDGLFCVQLWALSEPKLRRIHVVKFSADHHNRQISTPHCGAHFTCPYAAFAPNQRINSLFWVRRRCLGWSAAAGPVTDVLLKRRTQSLS